MLQTSKSVDCDDDAVCFEGNCVKNDERQKEDQETTTSKTEEESETPKNSVGLNVFSGFGSLFFFVATVLLAFLAQSVYYKTRKEREASTIDEGQPLKATL